MCDPLCRAVPKRGAVQEKRETDGFLHQRGRESRYTPGLGQRRGPPLPSALHGLRRESQNEQYLRPRLHEHIGLRVATLRRKSHAEQRFRERERDRDARRVSSLLGFGERLGAYSGTAIASG